MSMTTRLCCKWECFLKTNLCEVRYFKILRFSGMSCLNIWTLGSFLFFFSFFGTFLFVCWYPMTFEVLKEYGVLKKKINVILGMYINVFGNMRIIWNNFQVLFLLLKERDCSRSWIERSSRGLITFRFHWKTC